MSKVYDRNVSRTVILLRYSLGRFSLAVFLLFAYIKGRWVKVYYVSYVPDNQIIWSSNATFQQNYK